MWFAVSAALGSQRHLIISFSNIASPCKGGGLRLNGKYAVHPGESINISSPKKVFPLRKILTHALQSLTFELDTSRMDGWQSKKVALSALRFFFFFFLDAPLLSLLIVHISAKQGRQLEHVGHKQAEELRCCFFPPSSRMLLRRSSLMSRPRFPLRATPVINRL